MDVPDVRAGGFSLFGLLLAFTLIAAFFFIVYWLWSCTCSESVPENTECNTNPRPPRIMNQAVVPLYAFEIEPGTVVLQSGDGEIFRVLREYDSVGRTGSGSPPLYASVTTSQPANEFHYMPSYTRAFFQTKPSAPNQESSHYQFGQQEAVPTPRRPPDYDQGDSLHLWTPVNTRNSYQN